MGLDGDLTGGTGNEAGGLTGKTLTITEKEWFAIRALKSMATASGQVGQEACPAECPW